MSKVGKDWATYSESGYLWGVDVLVGPGRWEPSSSLPGSSFREPGIRRAVGERDYFPSYQEALYWARTYTMETAVPVRLPYPGLKSPSEELTQARRELDRRSKELDEMGVRVAILEEENRALKLEARDAAIRVERLRKKLNEATVRRGDPESKDFGVEFDHRLSALVRRIDKLEADKVAVKEPGKQDFSIPAWLPYTPMSSRITDRVWVEFLWNNGSHGASSLVDRASLKPCLFHVFAGGARYFTFRKKTGSSSYLYRPIGE